MDKLGFYGEHGGQFIPELLRPSVSEIVDKFNQLKGDKTFVENFNKLLLDFAGRPTPITQLHNLSEKNGPLFVLKREDLLHTGAHKLNNALGQCLLAKMMGKTRIIAETGAGQHGVATATAAAKLKMPCTVFMGAKDMARQSQNVAKIRLLGAKIISVNEGAKTLKSAVNAALREWASSFKETYYCLGSALGPHPYPEMVAFFQNVIGVEARAQCLEKFGRLPDVCIAPVGGGSNAIGLFQAFLQDEVKLIGIEAGGKSNRPGEHAARLLAPSVGILHGCKSYVLQDAQGQIMETHSISAGLDYPMIGPEHANLFDTKRVSYFAMSDGLVKETFSLLAEKEGIIAALESCHAIAYALSERDSFKENDIILINCSGRGDKDMQQMMGAQYV